MIPAVTLDTHAPCCAATIALASIDAVSLMQSSATFPMRQFLGDGELFRDRLAVVIAARSFRVHPYARNITVGPQQLPHYVPRHFLASTEYSKDESPARPSRLCDRRSRLTTLSRHLLPMAPRSPQQRCA